MISLLNLMLLLKKTVSNGPTPTPKLPDAEYLDVSVVPRVIVTKIGDKRIYHGENLNTRLISTVEVSQVWYRKSYHIENLLVGISPTILVTKTGVNPL